MPPFRVFIAAEVIARLRTCPSREKRLITRLFDDLAKDPYRAGDYVERDDLGRPVQVLVIGR